MTLARVAEAAGVSVSTASAALSGTGRVSSATAERVREVAAGLGYRASGAARELRSGRPPVVGVVLDLEAVALHSNSAPALWWPRACLTMVGELAEQGVGVQLLSAGSPALARAGDLDAIVTVERPGGLGVLPDHLPFGVPVFVGGDIDQPARPLGRVAPSFDAAVREALDHLADAGSRQPGLLTLPARLSFAEHMEAAHDAWCRERRVRPVVVGRDGGSWDRRVEEALRTGCDGLLCLEPASEEILAAVRRRAAVPGEVRLVVVSEGLIEQHLRPSVTTLSFQGEVAGRLIAAAVLEALESGRPRDVRLPHLLSPRESTAAVRATA